MQYLISRGWRLRVIVKSCWVLTVVALVSFALMISLARLVLPVLGEYKQDIEVLLEESFDQSLSIGVINANINGISPSLQLLNVSMLDKTTSEPLLFFDEVYIDVNIVKSVFNWRPELENLTVVGLDLAVERNEQGQIVVAGVKGGAKRTLTGEREQAVQWVLSQDWLRLEQATIRWLDSLDEQSEQVFTDLSLQVSNSSQGVKVIGNGFLPGVLGGEFDYIFNFDPENIIGKTRGDGYVSVAGAKLSPWQSKVFAGADGYKLEGEMDVAAWLSWSEGQLNRVDLNVTGRSIVAEAPGYRRLSFEGLNLLARLYSEKNSWDLVVDDLSLSKAGSTWLSLANSGVRFRLEQGVSRFDVGVNALDVAKMSVLALRLPGLNERLRRALLDMKPVATVNDLYVRWQKQDGEDARYFVRAKLVDFGGSHFEKIPAFSGVDGAITVANEGWSLDLNTENARVDFAGLFRDPIEFSSMTGVISGESFDDSWRVWSDEVDLSNTHLSASTYFTLQKEKGQLIPELDLVVTADRGDASYTSRYLPVGIMKEKVVTWLDKGIVGGRVTAAGVTYRGPVKKSFPFDNLDGRFEVQVAFEEGVVSYAPGWPPIVDATGQLIFNEQSMLVQGHSAMTLDATLSDVRVSIPKFKADDRAVYIEGHAAGPSSNGLLFLTTTPLSKKIGRYFQGARASGSSELDLTLRIPINNNEHQLTIKGVNEFFKSDLLFDDIGVDLAAIDGVLTFTERGVSAESLRGEVLGLPVEASMRTEVSEETQKEAYSVIVEGHGLADPQALLHQFKLPIFGDMVGGVPWSGRLVLPSAGNVSLEVQSNLKGVEVDIPLPVGKPASQLRALSVNMQFPFNASNLLYLKYGDELQGVFELASEDEALVMRRGEIRYGDGEAQLPSGKGLSLVAKANFYDHSQWMAYLSRYTIARDEPSEGVMLAQLDLFFERALFYGQIVNEMSIEMVEAGNGLLGVIIGPDVAGHMSIPSGDQLPLTLDLDYLYFRTEDSHGAEPAVNSEVIDPGQLGALRLVVRSLYRDNVLLGRLVVELQPGFEGRGVEITRADLNGDYVSMHAQGGWQVVPGSNEQRTTLDATVDSRDMGVLLGLFGYTDNLDRGRASNQMRLGWAGGPADFALDKLDGELVFNIKSGALLEVNPGAGRIFGLLSVQALPRRLTLDFRDLFAKGLAFDEIKGTVTLGKGEAFTEDLRLKGPALEVSIVGYVDLIGKKYNQYVTVEPNYTGTLPLAVAVIVNPVAGVAAWFAERLLRRPVSDIAKILYHVTGSWDSPSVERLGRLDDKRIDGALPAQP